MSYLATSAYRSYFACGLCEVVDVRPPIFVFVQIVCGGLVGDCCWCGYWGRCEWSFMCLVSIIFVSMWTCLLVVHMSFVVSMLVALHL